ncbi:MAG: hypothetical protein Ta2B_23290 [Termitinemataceae bacterium]|nr:MAG: hypothetical protein Ta2B_23290 [Termitinemataceae bacterium]
MKNRFFRIIFFAFLITAIASCDNKFLQKEGGVMKNELDPNDPENFETPEDMPYANFYFVNSEDDLKIKLPKVIDGTWEINGKPIGSMPEGDIIFALSRNITYGGEPIAIGADGFKSKFYGNGYSVVLNGGKALFAVAGDGAVFRNIMIDAEVPVSNLIDNLAGGGKLNSVGILVGETNGAVEFSDVTITGDISISDLSGASSSATFYVGAITGKYDNSASPTATVLKHCAYLGNIVVTPASFSNNILAGGLIGIVEGANIENSFATTQLLNIRGATNVNVGGICGQTDGTIKYCYVNGIISAFGNSGAAVGGITYKTTNADDYAITKCAVLIRRIETSATATVNRVVTNYPTDPSRDYDNYAYVSLYCLNGTTPSMVWGEDLNEGNNAMQNGQKFGSDAKLYFGLATRGFYDDAAANSVTASAIQRSALEWSFPTETSPGDWRWASNGWPLPIPLNCIEPPTDFYTPLEL